MHLESLQPQMLPGGTGTAARSGTSQHSPETSTHTKIQTLLPPSQAPQTQLDKTSLTIHHKFQSTFPRVPLSHCSCSAQRNCELWELREEQLETLLLSLEVTSHQEGRVLSKHRDDLGLPCDLYCSRAAGTAAVITRRKFSPVFSGVAFPSTAFSSAQGSKS